MFTSTLYIALLTSLRLATASPLIPKAVTHPSSSADLALRSSDERVFLAYCYYGYPGSEMLYYTHDADSFTGQEPDDIAFLGNTGATIPYEGQVRRGNFASTGDYFISEIVADGASLPDDALAGLGRNQYHAFRCYKDNGRQLFEAVWGGYTQVCRSQYYCIDA